MPSDEVLKKLADIIKTTGRRDSLLAELEEISRNGIEQAQENQSARCFGNANPFDQNKYPLFTLVAKELDEHLGINANQNSLEEVLEKLKNLLASMGELVVEVPESVTALQERDEKSFNYLTEQIADVSDKPSLLSMRTSSDLISGLTLSYKGKYVNLSLNKLIKDKLYG